MALVSYLPEDPDDDRLRELFAADADVYGRPSLFARVLGHDPALLAARQRYTDAVLDGDVLDGRLAELVYAAVAAERDCPYCAAIHADRLLDHVGADEAAVDAVLVGDFAGFSERERAVLAVATAVAGDPRRVGDDDVDRLRSLGFDDADVVRFVVAVSAAVAATVVADALNVHPADREGLSNRLD